MENSKTLKLVDEVWDRCFSLDHESEELLVNMPLVSAIAGTTHLPPRHRLELLAGVIHTVMSMIQIDYRVVPKDHRPLVGDFADSGGRTLSHTEGA